VIFDQYRLGPEVDIRAVLKSKTASIGGSSRSHVFVDIDVSVFVRAAARSAGPDYPEIFRAIAGRNRTSYTGDKAGSRRCGDYLWKLSCGVSG